MGDAHTRGKLLGCGHEFVPNLPLMPSEPREMI